MARRQHPQQVVERRADVTHVDLDVRERGSPERDHDVAPARGIGHALGQRQPTARMHPVEQLLRAGLRERHPAFPHRVQAAAVVVDSNHLEAAVGEGQRQRQADAAEADH